MKTQIPTGNILRYIILTYLLRSAVVVPTLTVKAGKRGPQTKFPQNYCFRCKIFPNHEQCLRKGTFQAFVKQGCWSQTSASFIRFYVLSERLN